MPEIDKIAFDGDASGSGPYFIQGDVVEHPGGRPGLWLVFTSTISSTTKKGEAVLHRIEFPSDDEEARAKAMGSRRAGVEGGSPARDR